MANEKFYLVFSEEPDNRVLIDEPIGWGEVDFLTSQKDKGHGRDCSLNGGESSFKFVDYRNHYIEKLLYYDHYYGFESNVQLIIVLVNGIEFSSELDFEGAVTDDLTYIEVKTIQQSSLQVVKRTRETKVDLFSNKDINGDYIAPLVPNNLLVLAKPVLQTSQWDSINFNERLYADGTSANAMVFYTINPCTNILKSNIEDTFNFFDILRRDKFNSEPNNSDFVLIKAKNNLKNIKVNISDLLIHFTTDVDNGGDGYVNLELQLRYGKEYATATKIILLSVLKNENETYDFNGGFTHNIDSLQRDESIWVNFIVKVRQSSTVDIGQRPLFECFLEIPTIKTLITAESTSYSSITPSFRLIDVMKQIVKSNSGLGINAPRYDIGGEFYENRLVNGNLLRGITEKLVNGISEKVPFYVSLEDIEKSINPEHNADSEIGLDGKVFFGIEKDFYTSNEMMFFDTTQFSGMKRIKNPKFCINTFKLKFKNYQSLKENEELNSADAIHGESEWNLKNKRVENKKENEIEWARDSFLIESIRKKAIIISDDTSSQDDDTLICLDSLPIDGDRPFTETTTLNHTYNPTDNKLTLITDNSINFIVLGIKVGSVFFIEPNDNNSGAYLVEEVSTTTLKLSVAGTPYLPAYPSENNNGIRATIYTYTILESDVPFVIRTNEGITTVSNLQNPDRFANMRYSIKRNILNYWKSYLATCNLYTHGKEINNTLYKNNPKCTFMFDGKTTIEDESFIPDNPIITPFLYNDLVFANVDFEDYIDLQNKIRSVRGFIRTVDNNNRVLKVFPMSVKYVNANRELIINGQEKYEQSYLKITTNNNYIMINGETGVKRLIYKIEDYKVYLYDKERQRLYNGVFWNQVSINGATATNIDELKQRLNLIGDLLVTDNGGKNQNIKKFNNIFNNIFK
jgi:hypothetical protein